MEPTQPTTCRCGHPSDSTEPHPCHGDRYICRKPAERFFYNPRPAGSYASLAGMQMKLELAESWGCPECRATLKAQIEAYNKVRF